MMEYFKCPGCGNRNLIDWAGRPDESVIIPCLGCCYVETIGMIKLADGRTERFDRNNPEHVSRDENGTTKVNGEQCQGQFQHGQLIVAERGKGETANG